MTHVAESRTAIVITGATAGIGRSIAKVAAREGGAIVLIGRSPQRLDEVADEVRQSGGEAFPLELDLLAPDRLQQIDQFLLTNGLVCDVLVNSAGYGVSGATASIPLDQQLGLIDLNVRVLTELTLHFLPQMLARGRGGIINLSSVASFTPGPYMSLYYASKSFVRVFSEALHYETRRTGVTVTCVAPGPVKTKFLQKAGADRTRLFRLLPRADPDFVAQCAWAGYLSGRRLVVPGLTAKLAVFGASILPRSALTAMVGTMQNSSGNAPPTVSGRRA